MRLVDLTGKRFHRLTVQHRAPGMNGATMWACRCECGQLTTVQAGNLKNGGTKSCGCHRRDAASVKTRTHGLTDSPEYRVWTNMKVRCYDASHKSYPIYGGRGIAVCDRWRNDFTAFYADMGPRPVRHTLDRIDTDGPYSPENCRWATQREQMNNVRHNHRLTYLGVTRTIAEWERHLWFPKNVIGQRIASGWSITRALTTSLKLTRRHPLLRRTSMR